jgi:hypothetical protein
MLAMVSNDNAGNLIPRDAFEFFASMLAPTVTTAREIQAGR